MSWRRGGNKNVCTQLIALTRNVIGNELPVVIYLLNRFAGSIFVNDYYLLANDLADSPRVVLVQADTRVCAPGKAERQNPLRGNELMYGFREARLLLQQFILPETCQMGRAALSYPLGL
jgi:hypothetical protein